MTSSLPRTATPGWPTDTDGTSYTVPGRSGNGLPAGKYRIVVRQWDPFPDFDRLGGRFDEQNSPIIREITEDTEINIDVSRPEG
jgi:hypothetical protein